MKMGRSLLVITAGLMFFLGSSQISSASSEIYIKYYAVNGWNGQTHSIIIYRDGSIWADHLISNENSYLIERRLGKLTKAEIADLIETVIKENDFFGFSDYIDTGLGDGANEELTVAFQGKTHSAGGFARHVKDHNFGNIVNKIDSLSARFSKLVLSLSEWQNFCRAGQKIKKNDCYFACECKCRFTKCTGVIYF